MVLLGTIINPRTKTRRESTISTAASFHPSTCTWSMRTLVTDCNRTASCSAFARAPLMVQLRSVNSAGHGCVGATWPSRPSITTAAPRGLRNMMFSTTTCLHLRNTHPSPSQATAAGTRSRLRMKIGFSRVPCSPSITCATWNPAGKMISSPGFTSARMCCQVCPGCTRNWLAPSMYGGGIVPGFVPPAAG